MTKKKEKLPTLEEIREFCDNFGWELIQCTSNRWLIMRKIELPNNACPLIIKSNDEPIVRFKRGMKEMIKEEEYSWYA